MSNRLFSFPPVPIVLPPALWLALLALATGCHPTPRPAPPSTSTSSPGVAPEDRVLAMPSHEFLAYREQLARRGQWQRAHDAWAERVLLVPGAPAPDTREGAWSQHLQSAIAAYEQGGNRLGRTAERLAEACDRAGWFREAKLVLAGNERSGTLSPGGERLLGFVQSVDELSHGLDSLVTPAPPAGTNLAQANAASTARAVQVARRVGITNEGLRPHGLLVSVRPWPGGAGPDRIELAVVAGLEGPLTVRQGAGTFTVRRFVLDDNAVREPIPPHPWDSATLYEIEEGALVAYHRRDYLRTEAVALYRILEGRGGAPPRSSPGVHDSVLAQDLRLQSVLPLFDRARAEPGPRREILRRFVTSYIAARMAQGEAAGGSDLLRERAGAPAGDDEGAAQRLLAVLEFGPLPRLTLADAIERGEREPGAEGEGARRVLQALGRTLAEPPAGPAALAALSDDRLRALAHEIDETRAFAP